MNTTLAKDDPSLLEARAVAERLGVDPASGLTPARAAEHLARDGKNELTAAAEVPVWRKLLLQLADPLIYLLLGAVVVSFVAWIFEGAHGLPFEALVVLGIVCANALLGYLEEAKAERAVAALQRLAATTASVSMVST